MADAAGAAGLRLTALASLDEAVATSSCATCWPAPADDETRYGAFRACAPSTRTTRWSQGELLNDSFWLHRVAPGRRRRWSTVHDAAGRDRAVRRGAAAEAAVLVPGRRVRRHGRRRTTTAAPSAASRSSGGASSKQCSLKLEDVLRTMAEMGGDVPRGGRAAAAGRPLQVPQLPRRASTPCRRRVASTTWRKARQGRGRRLLDADDRALPAAPTSATPTLMRGSRRPLAAAAERRNRDGRQPGSGQRSGELRR